MVSRLRRDASAVGMAAQWGWMAGLLSFGLCSGMSAFISQYWGIQNLKGHSPRHGTWPSDGDFYFDGFFRCGILRAGGVLGFFNSDPAVVDAGCRYLRIVCFSLSGCCLDVSFVERSARHGAGEAAALCFHRHDDCKRLCGLRPDFRRVRSAAARCRGCGARDVYFLMAGSCPDPRLLSIREEPPDGAGQGTLCVLSSRRGRVLCKGPSCYAQRRPLGARHADAQPHLREHRLRVLRGHDDFQDLSPSSRSRSMSASATPA